MTFSAPTSILLLFAGLWLLSSCYFDNEEDLFQNVQPEACDVVSATYSTDIFPLLENHCLRCHNNTRADGNVNLQGYNNLRPYAADGSLLGTTDHSPGYSVMPTSGVKIPICEIEQLRVWINAGFPNN